MNILLLCSLSRCSAKITSPDSSLSAVSPQAVCGDQRTTVVGLTGTGFTPLPVGTLTAFPQIQLPKISLHQNMRPDGSAGTDPDLTVPDDTAPPNNHVRWNAAEKMDFDVYPGLGGALPDGPNLAPGLYDVSVTNPDGRAATDQGSLAVVPAPTLKAAVPVPVCDAQGNVSFTLTGTGFIPLNGEQPMVSFTAPSGTQAAAQLATAASGCTILPSPAGLMLSSCTGLTVTVAKGTLMPGSYRVAVTNPKDTGCTTIEDVRVVVVPPPAVTQIMSAMICTAQSDSTVVLSGTGFLVITDTSGTRGPQVTINGASFASTTDDCTPVPDAPNAQTCTTLKVTVPKGALMPGMYPLVVKNPAPADCQTDMMLSITDVPPPTLQSVKPTAICAGGGTLTLTGTFFRTGAVVTINSVPSVTVTVSGDQTMATAAFGGPFAVGGPYDVTIQNPDSCQATLMKVETVTPGPSVLFVDPPAVPGTVSTQVTVYASGVGGAIQSVAIAPTGTVNFTKLIFSPVPTHINRALAIVPAGLAAGKYDLQINDATACPAILPGALTVVATPTLTVSTVVPGAGTTAMNTAVLVNGTAFVSTPRVYLNPTGNPPDSRAQALSAVTFQSATQLSGVVLQGLSPGAYDVLVINPDGNFGILTKGYTVTSAAAPPPIVTSIVPSAVVTGVATTATIAGSGFRAGVTVALSCQDGNGNAVGGGTASVTTINATSITAQITGTGILCIVRVTNQDGTFFDYSAIGVTNASNKLTGFTVATNLTTARRALGASAGRPTFVNRFVYAIGGDNGTDAAPLATVEAAPTSLSGKLGSFFALSQSLPKARSFLGVVNISRFLYAVGGFDGSKAASDVYRAQLLDPTAVPQISDVDVLFDKNMGLGAGQYIYRISAALNSTDPSNPSGETLAGDFFPIQLPPIAGKLQLVLTWTPVPNATQYKIFRSPKPGDAAGKELLLATVPAMAMQMTYTDNGSVTPAASAPLPLGSIGAWRVLPSLITARIGAGVTAVQDPGDTTGTKWYLYAAAGNSATMAAPTPLNSIESLAISIASDGSQTFGAWQTSAKTLPTAVWLAPAMPATPGNNSVIPTGSAYLYIGAGSTGSITTLNKPLYVAQVIAGGALGTFADSGSVGIGRTAYGGIIVNGLVEAFGGFKAGSASTNSDNGGLSSPTALGNFNNLGGGVLLMPRALQGTALESAFIYQLGGANAGLNTAQATTEQTVW